MGEVIRLPTANVPPDEVLEGAKDKLDTVLVVGKYLNGSVYLACSTADCGEANLLIDRAKHFLMLLIAEQPA